MKCQQGFDRRDAEDAEAIFFSIPVEMPESKN